MGLLCASCADDSDDALALIRGARVVRLAKRVELILDARQ
jgi:hypothetical protein